MKNLIAIATVLIATQSFAQQETPEQIEGTTARDCRSVVVEANDVLESPVDADSFSNSEFKDFELTTTEFNALDSEAQGEIYMAIRPMSDMVDEAISGLSRKIRKYSDNGFYEYYYSTEITAWQDLRSELKACNE